MHENSEILLDDEKKPSISKMSTAQIFEALIGRLKTGVTTEKHPTDEKAFHSESPQPKKPHTRPSKQVEVSTTTNQIAMKRANPSSSHEKHRKPTIPQLHLQTPLTREYEQHHHHLDTFQAHVEALEEDESSDLNVKNQDFVQSLVIANTKLLTRVDSCKQELIKLIFN